MIDFRYHLVSIVAVFLALGLGLLLGSVEFSPKLAHSLQRLSNEQVTEIGQQNGEIRGYKQFVAATEPLVLGHLLTGEHVVIVAAPSADPNVVSGVASAITAAGGEVTSQVQLLPQFTTASQAQLQQEAQQLTPSGQPLPTGSATSQAAQVLSGALLTKDGPGQPVPGLQDSTSTATMDRFVKDGYLTLSGQPPASADLAVLVAPSTPPTPSDASPETRWLVTLSQHFESASEGTVVAASSVGSVVGSVIDSLRASGVADTVSNVDDADTLMGDIVVVQALCKELRHEHGSYGMVGAGSAGPTPAPTPSPTATPTPTSSTPTQAHHTAGPLRQGTR